MLLVTSKEGVIVGAGGGGPDGLVPLTNLEN